MSIVAGCNFFTVPSVPSRPKAGCLGRLGRFAIYTQFIWIHLRPDIVFELFGCRKVNDIDREGRAKRTPRRNRNRRAARKVDFLFTCSLHSLSYPMKTEDISVSFAGLTSTGRIPNWAKDLNASRTTLDELSHRKSLSGILVLEDAGSKQMEHAQELVSLLASNVRKSSDPVRLLLNVPSPPGERDALARDLRLWRASSVSLERTY